MTYDVIIRDGLWFDGTGSAPHTRTLGIRDGVVAAVASAVLLKESRGPRPRLDLVGLPLIALGLLALVWADLLVGEIGTYIAAGRTSTARPSASAVNTVNVTIAL